MHPVPPYRVAYTTFRELGEPSIAWDTVRVTDARNNPVNKLAATRILSSARAPQPAMENPMNPHACSCQNPLKLSRNQMIALGVGAAAVLGFTFYKMGQAKAAPALPAPSTTLPQQVITPGITASRVAQVNPGTNTVFEVVAGLPVVAGQALDKLSMAAALSTAGWSGQFVYFPGDPASAWPEEITNAGLPINTNFYVFKGTYAGPPINTQQAGIAAFVLTTG